MDFTENDLLGWSRIFALVLGMGWAAWMDHKERRVGNDHWLVWVKPALFLWALDLMNQGADWTIYLTASAVVAYASGAVLGRPSLTDLRNGSRLDGVVLLWYAISSVGLVAGAIAHQSTQPLDVLLGNDTSLGALWWKTLSVLFVILIIDGAWRLRLLHGGSRCKGSDVGGIALPKLGYHAFALVGCNDGCNGSAPTEPCLTHVGRVEFPDHTICFAGEEHPSGKHRLIRRFEASMACLAD